MQKDTRNLDQINQNKQDAMHSISTGTSSDLNHVNAPEADISDEEIIQIQLSEAEIQQNASADEKITHTAKETRIFDRLYQENYEYVYARAKHFCRNSKYDPKDLTQDTFLKFAKYLPSFLSKAQQFPKAYLSRICETIFYNQVSRKSIKVSALEFDKATIFIADMKPQIEHFNYFAYPIPHYIGYINDAFKDDPKLKNILLTLPENHLKAFADFLFGQLKTHDISKKYNAELMTVLGWISRAKKEINQRYRHELEVPDHYYNLNLKHTQKNLIKKGPYWYIRKLVDDQMLFFKNNPKAWRDEYKATLEAECHRLDQENASIVLLIFCAFFVKITPDAICTILNNHHSQLELDHQIVEQWDYERLDQALDLATEINTRLNIQSLFKPNFNTTN